MLKAGLLNIPSTIEDPNYRYKMPRLQLKIEGKGNGIKTNLVNLHDVAKSLRCPDEYPLKFLGFELGSSVHYTFKNENDVTCIINGAFQEDAVRKFLDKFIEKYILCPSCKYPEMFIKVRKGKLHGQCECCGTKSDLDNVHRLAAFIEKNPPKQFRSLKEGQGDNKTQAGAEGVSIDGKKIKAKIMNAEELQLGGEYMNQALSTLRETYQRQAPHDQVIDLELAQHQITADIRSCNIKNGLHDRVCYLIFQSMFDHNIGTQVGKNSPLLDELYKKVEPPHPQVQILLNIEHLINLYQLDFKYVPTILKFFYDEELLEGDFLLQWGNNKGWCDDTYLQSHFLWNQELDYKVKEAADPILKWLKQDDEEDEDDEATQHS